VARPERWVGVVRQEGDSLAGEQLHRQTRGSTISSSLIGSRLCPGRSNSTSSHWSPLGIPPSRRAEKSASRNLPDPAAARSSLNYREGHRRAPADVLLARVLLLLQLVDDDHGHDESNRRLATLQHFRQVDLVELLWVVVEEGRISDDDSPHMIPAFELSTSGADGVLERTGPVACLDPALLDLAGHGNWSR